MFTFSLGVHVTSCQRDRIPSNKKSPRSLKAPLCRVPKSTSSQVWGVNKKISVHLQGLTWGNKSAHDCSNFLQVKFLGCWSPTKGGILIFSPEWLSSFVSSNCIYYSQQDSRRLIDL